MLNDAHGGDRLDDLRNIHVFVGETNQIVAFQRAERSDELAQLHVIVVGIGLRVPLVMRREDVPREVEIPEVQLGDLFGLVDQGVGRQADLVAPIGIGGLAVHVQTEEFLVLLQPDGENLLIHASRHGLHVGGQDLTRVGLVGRRRQQVELVDR